MDAAALVVVARFSWAEPVPWCCPVSMAMWAAWLPGCGVQWRSVLAEVKTCSIFGRTGSGEDRSLLEGVVAAIIARHVAPGKTPILGSGGGGAPVSFLS